MAPYALATVVLLLLLRASSPDSNPFTAVVDSPHPMLFFTLGDVPSLQLKARTSASHRAITERIVAAAQAMKKYPDTLLPPRTHAKFTSIWNEEFGNNLCTLAMYCVLFPSDEAALSLAHQFMDIMASYESWEFSKMAADEMPISHSLVGMATAYDFLYPTLSVEQRQTYFERIRKTTARHFERFKDTSWGRWHLQNHVWNNNVALFIGAIVTAVHDPRADLWAESVIDHLNISMSLFSLIVDGSNSEGVSYSTLTARSLMMFVNLMERHYGKNYYHNYWLHKYFGFLYGTLIGYTETIGIADANPTWFFGPESMLVFLDKFVMRNGHGNWLASRIRDHRSRDPPWANIRVPAISQRWATYHTEFLWYDETLGETDPNPTRKPRLALFSDWGVVTYGGGLPPGRTFFSFKCGLVAGRAINRAVLERDVFPQHIEGWKSFNPGHEHPDQGSFTFWPRGKPFITEAYYGPKFSFLNNGLMFAPSLGKCFPPYAGQIGECHKWLDYAMPEQFKAHADVIAAYEVGEFVFTSGELAEAYHTHLLLRSVYRSVLLLSPDMLIVVDHVSLQEGSTVDRASAFFNMRQGTLSLTHSSSSREALLSHSEEEEDFHATWVASSDLQCNASTAAFEFPCEFKTRESQLLNITFRLRPHRPSRTAYIFWYGSTPRPALPAITAETDLGCRLSLSVGETRYNISIATQHRSVVDRLNWLGHTGFATLSSSEGDFVRFGHGCATGESHHGTSLDSYLPTVFLSGLEHSGADLLAGVLNVSQDFAVIGLPDLQAVLRGGADPARLKPCSWEATDRPGMPEWLAAVFSSSYLSLRELHPSLGTLFPAKPHSRLVVHSGAGELSAEMNRFPLTDSTRLIHFLRDPRAWIAAVTKTDSIVRIWNEIMKMMTTLDCPVDKLIPPFQKLHALVEAAHNSENFDLVEALALYWSGHTLGALQSEQSSRHLKVVWLEALVREPEATLEGVMEGFLGLPLAPASRHLLLQYTRSSELRLPSGELLRHTDMEWWRRVLHPKDVRTVEWTVSEYINLKDYV